MRSCSASSVAPPSAAGQHSRHKYQKYVTDRDKAHTATNISILVAAWTYYASNVAVPTRQAHVIQQTEQLDWMSAC